MVRITLMDGSKHEMERGKVRGIFPFRSPLVNPHFRHDGVIYFQGSLYPVHGPLAPTDVSGGSPEARPWYLLCEGYAQVIRGLPQFNDDIQLNIVPISEEAPSLAPVRLTSPSSALESSAEPASPASDEAEEAQLLQELEDLLQAG